MGIRKMDLDIIENVLKDNNLKYKDLKILQLGDQLIRGLGERIIAKKYFEKLGCKVVSIDINGHGGSLPLDLSKQINIEEYKNNFDLVTNFGTSEHVSDHFICFDNIHNFCKPKGFIINLVPRIGFWNVREHEHAHKYDNVFFEKLAKKYNYKIIENRIVSGKERFGEDIELDSILAILKKE